MYKNNIVTTHWTRVVHEESLLELSELYLSHYKPVYVVLLTKRSCIVTMCASVTNQQLQNLTKAQVTNHNICNAKTSSNCNRETKIC